MISLVCQQEKKWFVLFTRPKYEKKIAQEISLMNYENYLPLRTTFRKWSDRIKKIEEPLFPNYLFVKTSMHEKYKVLSADGVVRFVSFEGSPVPVSEAEIASIKKIESTDQDISFEQFSRIGEKVRVIHGAFTGLEGELIRMPKGPRLLIKLRVINYAISVEIQSQFVQKIV